MNILFLYLNLLDAATLTASSENANFPAANLKNPFRGKPWRTAGVTPGTANLVIDHTTAKAVNCIALIGYNWASAPGTLNLEFNSADSWSPAAETEALTWAVNPTANLNPAIIIKTFASKTYRYNRLNVVYSPGGTPTDWDLGRIFLGTYFEGVGHFNYPWGVDLVDDSIVSRTIGGQDHTDEIPQYRVANFTCTARTQALWESHQKMANTVGKRKDFVIAFDYTSEPDEMTIYGRFTRLPGMSAPGALKFNLPYTFKETR